jgi:hypothetical protein
MVVLSRQTLECGGWGGGILPQMFVGGGGYTVEGRRKSETKEENTKIKRKKT